MLEPLKIKDGRCGLFELEENLHADYEGIVRRAYKPENLKNM